MNRLRITLLGPLEVTASDGELYVPQGGPRALLAALALRPGRTLHTPELTAALWDGAPPPDAHTRIRAWAQRLSAALDPDGTGRRLVQETGPTGPEEGTGFRLSPRDVEVDAVTFSSLLAQAAGAREQAAEPALLGRALELWRGAPLAGVASPALHRSVVPSLREEHRRAARRRAELELRAPLPTPPAPYGCELPPEPDLLGQERADEAAWHEELDTLFAPARGGTPRDLVLLHGSAGTGKSALAARWAHRARALFPDGVFWLDLRGRGPSPVLPSTATRALLTTLGLGSRHLPPTATARLSLLRTALAGRRVLLVLDDAASAAQVRCLVPGGAGPGAAPGPGARPGSGPGPGWGAGPAPGPRVLVTGRLPLPGLPDAGSALLHLPDPAPRVAAGVPGGCRGSHAPLG